MTRFPLIWEHFGLVLDVFFYVFSIPGRDHNEKHEFSKMAPRVYETAICQDPALDVHQIFSNRIIIGCKRFTSRMLLFFVLGICVFSDIGGYIVGKSIGGKKLTKISPNKTISGSIGSFLFSLFPLGVMMIIEQDVEDGAVLFCLSLSLACQLGDLIISYFKRLAKVKDTGKILPGHGGMLDRIDGIIFGITSTPIIIVILL